MHYQPVHRKALALSYMLVLVKYYSLRKMTERGNYFIKTWSRSLLYPGLSFCLRYKKYELDVGLGEWKPTFFLLLQKFEKLDRERGEGVRQHALNMMWWTAACSGEGYGLLCRTVTKILVFVKNSSPKIWKKNPSVMPPSVFQRVGSQWLNWAGHWQANWWEKKGEEKEGRERARKGQQPRKEKAAFIKDCSDSREVPLRLFYENCEGKGLEK